MPGALRGAVAVALAVAACAPRQPGRPGGSPACCARGAGPRAGLACWCRREPGRAGGQISGPSVRGADRPVLWPTFGLSASLARKCGGGGDSILAGDASGREEQALGWKLGQSVGSGEQRSTMRRTVRRVGGESGNGLWNGARKKIRGITTGRAPGKGGEFEHPESQF
jgi:hypothetical protein